MTKLNLLCVVVLTVMASCKQQAPRLVNELGDCYTGQDGLLRCPFSECMDAQDNPLCASDQFCRIDSRGNGTCEDCFVESDGTVRGCPDGYGCTNYVCVRPEEMPDAGLPPDGEVSDQGVEPDLGEPECTSSAECGECSGDVCFAGMCFQVPGGEVCDGEDNDCDGAVDEEFGNLGTSCTVGLGVCASGGIFVCSADGLGTVCDATAGKPTAEVCNGLDEDCDGVADNGFSSVTTTCGVGVCASTGTFSCTGGTFVNSCVPGTPASSDATCNGLDEDCDGAVDEDYVRVTTTCGVGLCASSGLTSCTEGQVESSCQEGAPTAEVCDGADNDCDGAVDEEFGNLGTSCTVGLGVCASGGTFVCAQNGLTAVCDATAGMPTAETCNGLDEDCDGATDEGLGLTTCGLGECVNTAANCVDGAMQFCNPFQGSSAEVCGDGVDQDCNGSDLACPPPPPPVCGDGACNGTETCADCSADCGVCPPPPVTCTTTLQGSYTTADLDGDGVFGDVDGILTARTCGTEDPVVAGTATAQVRSITFALPVPTANSCFQVDVDADADGDVEFDPATGEGWACNFFADQGRLDGRFDDLRYETVCSDGTGLTEPIEDVTAEELAGGGNCVPRTP